ncbi:MAG: trigger factor [Planctomycetes bacterium]|nr:trigger factor [Planctomycetota bacterium]
MKHEVKEVGPCKLAISVELESEKVKDAIATKYRDLAQRVAIPGFRKGHVPHKILEKRFGKDLLQEAKRDLVESTYKEVLEERKLSPLGDPELDLEKITLDAEKPLAYEITVEIKPAFEVKDYKGLKVGRPKTHVSEEEVVKGLDRLREAKAELEPVEGPAAEEDILVCDHDLRIDDASVATNENVSIPVAKDISIFGKPHPEVFALLVGAKAGETREFAVKIPETFDKPEHRGKDAVVRFTLHEVKRKKLPEITEAWAKELDFDSLDALKQRMRQRILEEKESAATEAVEDQLLQKILAATPFPIPEGLVARGVDSLMKREQVHMEMRGLTEEAVKARMQEIETSSKEFVTDSIRVHFLLDEIAKKERIFATESEVEDRLHRIAQATNRWPAEVRKDYEEKDMMSQLRTDIRYDKVKAFLRTHAVIEEIAE